MRKKIHYMMLYHLKASSKALRWTLLFNSMMGMQRVCYPSSIMCELVMGEHMNPVHEQRLPEFSMTMPDVQAYSKKRIKTWKERISGKDLRPLYQYALQRISFNLKVKQKKNLVPRRPVLRLIVSYPKNWLIFWRRIQRSVMHCSRRP